MKRKYLTIRDRGFILRIPGLTEVRTPVTIDITTLPEISVKTYLNKTGIIDYEIGFKNIIPSKKHTPRSKRTIYNNKPNEIENTKNLIESKIDINMNNLLNLLVEKGLDNNKKINYKINKLTEKMLGEFNELRSIIENSNHSLNKNDNNNFQFENDETETFIPHIDNSDMKISSSDLSINTFKSDDISDSLNKLKILKGK